MSHCGGRSHVHVCALILGAVGHKRGSSPGSGVCQVAWRPALSDGLPCPPPLVPTHSPRVGLVVACGCRSSVATIGVGSYVCRIEVGAARLARSAATLVNNKPHAQVVYNEHPPDAANLALCASAMGIQ